MKVSIIAPIPELGHFGHGDIHLLLAHLTGDPLYAKHYEEQRRKGAYIILDNSAYELRRAMPAYQVRSLAYELDANEIVMPDILKDSVGTYDATSSSLHTTPQTFRLMMVPQGLDKNDWTWCLHRLLDAYKSTGRTVPPVIGLSKIHEKIVSGGRLRLIEEELDKWHTREGIDVHLLGFTTLQSVWNIAREFPWVRSVDTAKPIVAALAGVSFNPHYRQVGPDEMPARDHESYFTQVLTANQREVADHNILLLKEAAEGNPALI